MWRSSRESLNTALEHKKGNIGEFKPDGKRSAACSFWEKQVIITSSGKAELNKLPGSGMGEWRTGI